MHDEWTEKGQDGALMEQGKYRLESDSIGSIKVPAERLWGAQTQRSLHHFSIGDDQMPLPFYHAMGYVKKAAALIHVEDGILSQEKADPIIAAAEEVIAGKLDQEFPLYVWQTGSGTQSNMNVNEVIANRAIQIMDGRLGTKNPIHPNDDVNRSQSSNDTVPTAMHIATLLAIHNQLLPQLQALITALRSKAVQWVDVVKIGRTHLQDATPLTVGQEWSGYVVQLEDAVAGIQSTCAGLYQLAAGGTAVGTGINTPPNFGERMAKEIARQTGHPFITAPNKFAAQASVDPMVATSAALRGLAVALLKIANDIRWLSSGPRAGIHELQLPVNEPGSSIMPGKVNPTQEEAMMMVCTQVIGLDNAVAVAGMQGNFELNTMRPMVIYNVLTTIGLLTDACDHYRRFSIEGMTLNHTQIERHLNSSLMLVTALSPIIGYEKAAEIAQRAHERQQTLREAAMESGYLTAEEYDRIMDPRHMVGDPRKDLDLR